MAHIGTESAIKDLAQLKATFEEPGRQYTNPAYGEEVMIEVPWRVWDYVSSVASCLLEPMALVEEGKLEQGKTIINAMEEALVDVRMAKRPHDVFGEV